jgi:hypothetical protein
MNTYLRIFAAAICVSAFAAPATAAQFGGASHDITDFANGSEVSTVGTYISGVNLLNDNVGGVGVDTTINGVLFKNTAPGQFFEGGGSFANSSFVYHGGDGYADPNLWSSGGAYDTLADSQIFNIDNPNINAGDGYGVINLTPGTRYLLQVFMLDDRSGVSKTFPVQFQQVAWTGNFDQIDNTNPPVEIGYLDNITIGGNGVTQASGEIATVAFTIDPGYNGLLVNTWNNGAFNGMQLRQLGLAGDYDGNGTVGPEDYAIWKSSFGSTTNLAADGNLNGVVDAADYVIWRAALNGPGAGSGSALKSAAVPEPNTLLIASMAMAIFGGIFRSRRQFA